MVATGMMHDLQGHHIILLCLRKSTKPKPKSEYAGPYKTLCRGDNEQIQRQPLQAPTDLYDLSPSTAWTN